jgi:hypothetical protein
MLISLLLSSAEIAAKLKGIAPRKADERAL